MSEADRAQQRQDMALAQLRAMAAVAKDGDHKRCGRWAWRCIEGEVMLYVPYERALIPGHIYSDEGLKEARISGSCEYHFDRWFEPGWVDVITGEKGRTPPEEEEEEEGP